VSGGIKRVHAVEVQHGAWWRRAGSAAGGHERQEEISLWACPGASRRPWPELNPAVSCAAQLTRVGCLALKLHLKLLVVPELHQLTNLLLEARLTLGAGVHLSRVRAEVHRGVSGPARQVVWVDSEETAG
jgi:hypothetical protein